jgi:hypothetical protein
MHEQEKRAKVIKGLEAILEETADMFYRSTIQDAIALLKAQEPRVMTLEEIKALPDYVFLEDRDISHVFSIKTISRPALPQLVFVNISGEECVGFRGPDGDTSLVTSRYRVEWRCWTSRPTDEQREAVKWE